MSAKCSRVKTDQQCRIIIISLNRLCTYVRQMMVETRAITGIRRYYNAPPMDRDQAHSIRRYIILFCCCTSYYYYYIYLVLARCFRRTKKKKKIKFRVRAVPIDIADTAYRQRQLGSSSSIVVASKSCVYCVVPVDTKDLRQNVTAPMPVT